MNIGIDIDHVLLYGCDHDFLEFMVEIKGWQFDHAAFAATHNFNLATNRSTTETNLAFSEYVRSGYASRSTRPIPGAHAAVAVLRRHFHIRLVTGRTSGVDGYTSYELAHHFPGLDLHNMFTSGHLGAKHLPLSEYAANCHIDDSSYEIECLLNWCKSTEHSQARSFHIIQFPRLNGIPIPQFDDRRVLRPTSCNRAHKADTPQAQAELYEQAWHEILCLIANLHP